MRVLDVVPNVAPFFVGGHIVAVFEVGDGHDALAERGELVGESREDPGCVVVATVQVNAMTNAQANIIG